MLAWKPCKGSYNLTITLKNAALQLCDEKFIVKPVAHRDYLKQVLQIGKDHKVRLLVPTMEIKCSLLRSIHGLAAVRRFR